MTTITAHWTGTMPSIDLSIVIFLIFFHDKKFAGNKNIIIFAHKL